MALSPEQRLDLLSTAKDHWLRAEVTAYAYERALTSAKQRSDWLKAGIIVSALLTTVSGFAKSAWLTVSTGLLTTLLATTERLYSPAGNYQKYGSSRAELLGVRDNVVTFSITLNSINDVIKGAQPLAQFSQQIVAIMQKMPVTTNDEDAQKAQASFRLASMSQMIARAERDAGIIELITVARESLISRASSQNPEIRERAVKDIAGVVGQLYEPKDLVGKTPGDLLFMLQAKIEKIAEKKDDALRKKLTQALIIAR
jgi:hypothetical protein